MISLSRPIFSVQQTIDQPNKWNQIPGLTRRLRLWLLCTAQSFIKRHFNMRIRHIPRRIRSLITIFLLTVCTFIIHAHLKEESEKRRKAAAAPTRIKLFIFQRLSLSPVCWNCFQRVFLFVRCFDSLLLLFSCNPVCCLVFLCWWHILNACSWGVRAKFWLVCTHN